MAEKFTQNSASDIIELIDCFDILDIEHINFDEIVLKLFLSSVISVKDYELALFDEKIREHFDNEKKKIHYY